MSGCQSNVTYPDRAWCGPTEVVENLEIARDTYRIRFGCPTLAAAILPGQFLMLRLAGIDDPLLGRPLAMYDVVLEGGSPWGVDVVYQAVGKMTRRLAGHRRGDRLEVWGPLGNGFPVFDAEHLIMVGGGIGQTPFYALGQEVSGRSYGGGDGRRHSVRRATLCYGVRTAAMLAGVDDFRSAGIEVHLSTDDGTAGRRGLVTELVEPLIRQSGSRSSLVCCGPEPMLKAASQLARGLGVPCHVSLETPMACGLGICFSCVAKVRDGQGGWDYRRTCVEGPVFDAEKIEFD